jgi:hypothetical protein
MQCQLIMRIAYAKVSLNLVCIPAICHFQIVVIQPIFFSGVRGTSILFSSGDGGVGDGSSYPTMQTCITNDGKNHTRFMASFPASCPL